MVVFDKNEQDISVITTGCHSVLVISFSFYMTVIFLKEHDNIELLSDFFKSRPVLKNGKKIGKKSISLMFATKFKGIGSMKS
jgi:hypothetical protein